MTAHNETLVWMHEDMLRADHPAFDAVEADTRAVFAWDDAYFDKMDYGLKRRVFIYQCLLDLPVDIYHGETCAILRHFAPQKIITGKTPNPHLKAKMAGLRETCQVKTIADTPFVQLGDSAPLKRFFRYWNKARKLAFLPDGRA